MKKSIIFSIALFFSVVFSTNALEIKGVKISETVPVAGNTLVLNGAGVRTKMLFKVYVAALYLSQKKSDAESVLSDEGSKRITLHLLRSLTSEKLLHAIEEGFEANNSAVEMASIDNQMKTFRQMLTAGGAVKEGDVIVLDYAPDGGTNVSLNNKSLGNIEGALFNKALLRVWLGNHPVDEALKQSLLGK